MKKYSIFLLLTFIPLFCLWAENPKARLTYFDDAEEIEVYDFTGEIIESVHMGFPLLIGYGVRTMNSTAELELEPNGSIIKLKENSFMKIEELQGTKNARSNRFALVKGFIRMVASRLFDANYSVKTPSAVLGVRGTDFSVTVSPDKSSDVLVREGAVEVFNPSTRDTLLLEPGEGAGIRNRVTRKIEMEMEEVRRRISLFSFNSVAPDSVPRTAPKDYKIDFDYFSDIDYKEFREFFADEDFFDDSEEYLEQFREYYSEEMTDFKERFEEEKQSFEEYKNKEMNEYSKYNRWY